MKARGARREVRGADSPTNAGAAPRTGWGRMGGVLAALLVLGVAVVCIRLGFWQLDRLEQRRARNAQAEQALVLPALDLDARLLQEIERDPLAYLNRRVRVEGVYDPAGELVLRGRSRGGSPGVHLVTPLRIAGSEAAVLVNRGWVASPDAATLDPSPFSEPGIQQVEGLLQIVPAPTEGETPLMVRTSGGSVLTVRRLDLASLRARAAYPLLPVYVQQLPDPALRQPPFRLPLPTLDEGSHLGYAVQWFGFAAIFVLGFLIVLLHQRMRSAR
ncbi:SURF1 family protein [soil metagenome]